MLAFKALSFSFARVVEVGVAVLLVEAEVVQLTLLHLRPSASPSPEWSEFLWGGHWTGRRAEWWWWW